MSTFERKLSGLESVEMPSADHLAWMDHKLIGALFERWSLPGQGGGLRIAVRNNYLNFYHKGQSVAKLTPGRDVCKVELHQKYVSGGTDQKYHSIRGPELNDAGNLSKLHRWIENAVKFSNAEKTFVDDLVARNPSILDLEMGLPAYRKGQSAPRMDIVALQGDDIVFWEAKCSDNPELRAATEYSEDGAVYVSGPKVIHQLRKYQTWLAQDGARDTVISAYRNSARILARLAEKLGKSGQAVGIWRKAADNANLSLISSPGIIISNYCAGGPKPKGDCHYSARAGAFADNDHRSKLIGHNVQLQEICRGDDPTLIVLEERLVRDARSGASS